MYTQCPECKIAFRVTASVLQQAAGSVRCGSCGRTFSALAFLSEEMPQVPSKEPAESADNELAETSRRLLETLDDLAGPEDVRIEDTGIEWRVLDDDEVPPAAAEPVLIETAPDEMRFDDNTPLPDDFGDEKEEVYTPPPQPQRRSEDFVGATNEFVDRQHDLALSEPEDWTDLLDEVRDPGPDSLEVEEELAAIHTQLSARVDQPIGEAAPVDLDTQFETQAEAMGLSITSSEAALTEATPVVDEGDVEPEDESAQIAPEEEEHTEIREPAAEDEPEELAAVEVDDGLGEIGGIDEQDVAPHFDDREPTGEFEAQIEAAALALAGEEAEDDVSVEAAPEDEQAGDEEAGLVLEEAADDDEVGGDELEIVLEEAAGDDEAEIVLEDHGDDDESLAAVAEHVLATSVEEEIPVNMEVDQELTAATVEDDDASATYVGMQIPAELFDENAENVETIIMEGEFVRSEVEKERIAAENAAKSQLDDPGALADTYAMNRNKVRGGRRSYDPPGYGIVSAAALLALLLTVQFIHNSRESLATFGLFNQTIAPVYRMLGNPVTPEWNIRGWQFEATNGNLDEAGTTLTIVSRLVNRAEQSLPYPLIHVSLTDRWEEIMGSRILDPGDYLAGDLDPSQPVMPGEAFRAVITIEEPSVEATGFKLNVCYRVAPGRVRCAIEDFKR